MDPPRSSASSSHGDSILYRPNLPEERKDRTDEHMSNEQPRRPSKYARFTSEQLLLKIDAHLGMIKSIERELARRADAEKPS